MGVGVYVPKIQKADDEGAALQLIGMGAGAYAGGAQGAATGAQIGGALGAMNKGQASASPEAVTSGGSDAFQRRMQKLQENPQMQIANSIDSLKYIQDPQMRQDLAKPLLQADYMARNKQQV